MNPFSNPQSRGIDLPEDCKDLIDVINLNSSSAKAPIVVTSSLAELPAHVSRFLESQAKFKMLWIYGNALSVVAVSYSIFGPRALVLVDSAREPSVRTFFSGSGMNPFHEASLPNNNRSLHYQLSPDCDLKRFVRELLINGFGFTENTILRFSVHG